MGNCRICHLTLTSGKKNGETTIKDRNKQEKESLIGKIGVKQIDVVDTLLQISDFLCWDQTNDTVYLKCLTT